MVKCFSLADELRPFLEPGRSPRGLDVLSVEKQLAMTHDLVVNARVLIMRGKKWYFLLPSDILVNELTISVQQMQQETESCVLDDPLAVSSEKSENKRSHVRAIHPSKDLNRYIVDTFYQRTAKSKAAPFEAIDLSIYKPSARCLAFSTSEDRLLLWIVACQFQYYEITVNATDYTVI